MLSAIVRWSLRHAAVVSGVALLALLYGVYTLTRAQYDVFPDFVPPQAGIQTEAPGLTAEQVELLVTRPIEQAVSGTTGIETVRSESIQGLSVIKIIFRAGSDPFRARQLVAEALAVAAAQLPIGVRAPKLEAITSATMDLLKIGFVSTRLSPMELREQVQWTLRPRLLAVPGVARINIFGGEVRQIRVQIRPEALVARGLAFSDVVAALPRITGVRGGGFVETPNQRVLIEPRSQVSGAEDIGAAVLTVVKGLPVRIRDVADVTEAAEPLFGDALIMGKPGVLLTLSSQYGANTLEVTHAVEAALKDFAPLLKQQGIELYPTLHRPANFIDHALHGIEEDLLIGALLIAVVLYVFLRNWRTVLVSFVSIPLSLSVAVMVIDALGWTLNTMTLGGLAVALGVVVDDAIIDVENIARRLRSAGTAGQGRLLEVVRAASVEVRAPVVYATFAVALVLLPMLQLTGLQGSFFAPLAAAFIIATLVSLLVAISVTPALALLLFARAGLPPEPRFILRMRAMHERLLRRWQRHTSLMTTASVAAVLASAAVLTGFGQELLPNFREGHFVLGVSAQPGLSLAAMRELGGRLTRDLLAIDGISTVEQQIGRAEAGEDTWLPHRSEFHIELKPLPGTGEERVQSGIRAALARYPGLHTEVLTFLGDRIAESLSGETAAVAVEFYGSNLAVLDHVAQQAANLLKTMPGAADVQVRAPPGVPVLRVDLDQAALSRYGLNAADVLETVQSAYSESPVAQIQGVLHAINVSVALEPDHRQDPETIGDLPMRTLTGTLIPLRQLARIYLTDGRATILHQEGRRYQVVTLNPTTRDISGFVAHARQLLSERLPLPADVYVQFSGVSEAQAAAVRELALHAAAALLGIVLLLMMAFPNRRSLVLILASLPFALVGGVLAVAMTGATLSIGAWVGFVTLFGIAVRNAILLVAHIEQLVTVERMPWTLDTLLRGAHERLLPILMTALVTALGLVPLALGSGETGREVQGPMAVVILGGLVTSTAMNLIVLPLMMFRHWKPRR